MKISIIMPVFNRVDTLERALKSVIDQNDDEVELIILDAGSTDGSVDIIRQYAANITYWHSRPDKGAAEATNVGIELATGEVIGLLMADDWYEPGTFSALRQALSQVDTDMVTMGGRIAGLDLATGVLKTMEQFHSAQATRLTTWNVVINSNVYICCRFIKKSLYQRIGYYKPFAEDGSPFLSNDMEFLMRVMRSTVSNQFVPHMAYTHYSHAGSFSFSGNRAVIKRHCREHQALALESLSIEKKGSERLLLCYWYCDQSLRYAVYLFLDGEYKAALTSFFEPVRRYPVFWLVAPFLSLSRVVFKKILA